MHKLAFLFVFSACGAAPAASTVGASQPGAFRQTDLDAGGWLTGFASHSSGRLYARTDVGGVYRSDDQGGSWRFLSGGMTSSAGLYVQGLTVAEGSADVVFEAVGTSYAATDANRGVWRSADGGTSWTQVLANVNFSGNDDLRWQGECLAITPGSGDAEIFAISRKNGLWRSTTGGGAGTWSKQGGTLFDGMIGHVVHLHPAFPNDIFVGGVKDTGTSALYKGTRGNGGSITWSAVTVNAATTSVTRLVRLPSGVMFAAVQDGASNRFYKSDATGTTWTNITTTVLGGLTANGPVGMCHVLRDGVTIVLGWIGGPTRKSTNGGASWSTLPLAITGTRPAAMLTSDTSPGWSRGSLHQDPLDANRWYFPNGFGPFVSTDAGATVSYMTRGIGEVVTWKPSWHPNDAQRVYMPVADLIGFIATDGSETGLAPRNPRRSLPVSNGNVGMTYATEALVGPVTGQAPPKVYFVGGSFFGPNAGRASIVTTTDDGLNWSLVHVAGVTGTGLPAGSEIISGCVAPDDANEILVAVHDTANTNSGIFRSTDGGVSFTKSTGVPAGGNWGDEFSHFVFMEADAGNGARRFAWLNGIGFLISNDRGVTWAKTGHSSSGPTNTKLYDWNSWGCFVRDHATGRLWFGGMNGHLGLAYSTNRGTNWTYLDAPFSNTGFSDVRALDAHDGQVLVCAKRFGDTFFKIYYSDDNGAVWHECTKPGHRLSNATHVALNPHRRGHFWVATNGRSYARFTPGALGAWQQQHFSALMLNDPLISGAAADPDGDGQNNEFEFTAGLSPLNAQSRFVQTMQSVPAQPAQMNVQISPRFGDRNYTVEASHSLGISDDWLPLTNFTTSDTGDVRTFTDLNAGDSRKFYRVTITLP
ncbi:MAG: exo-alpha-sialidase [Verrucomicrobiales bacterium]|nr:exo-alpha-sialidase [Verrucomicrobiales bacterium]